MITVNESYAKWIVSNGGNLDDCLIYPDSMMQQRNRYKQVSKRSRNRINKMNEEIRMINYEK